MTANTHFGHAIWVGKRADSARTVFGQKGFLAHSDSRDSHLVLLYIDAASSVNTGLCAECDQLLDRLLKTGAVRPVGPEDHGSVGRVGEDVCVGGENLNGEINSQASLVIRWVNSQTGDSTEDG